MIRKSGRTLVIIDIYLYCFYRWVPYDSVFSSMIPWWLVVDMIPFRDVATLVVGMDVKSLVRPIRVGSVDGWFSEVRRRGDWTRNWMGWGTSWLWDQ